MDIQRKFFLWEFLVDFQDLFDDLPFLESDAPVAIARVKNVIWCHVPLHFIIIIALCHHHWSSSSATKKISPESSSLRLPSSQTSCQDRTSVGSEPGKYGKYHYPHIKVTVRRKKGKTKDIWPTKNLSNDETQKINLAWVSQLVHQRDVRPDLNVKLKHWRSQ